MSVDITSSDVKNYKPFLITKVQTFKLENEWHLNIINAERDTLAICKYLYFYITKFMWSSILLLKREQYLKLLLYEDTIWGKQLVHWSLKSVELNLSNLRKCKNLATNDGLNCILFVQPLFYMVHVLYFLLEREKCVLDILLKVLFKILLVHVFWGMTFRNWPVIKKQSFLKHLQETAIIIAEPKNHSK